MKILIGDLFESRAKTLVNTVNCVGVMGKGIAKEFKKRYAAMFADYEQKCAAGQLRPGIPYLYHDRTGISILNFPTKDHWRSPSRLSYIVQGLDWFRDNYRSLGIESIAFPPLGCGNGGLDWETVGKVMYEKLNDLPLSIEIYAPFGTPYEQLTDGFLSVRSDASAEMTGNTGIRMNKYWFLILYIIQKLNSDRYSLNVGRTIFQKICYLLTREGLPTGFHFVKGSYGPYAQEVKNAVTALSNANLMSERTLGKMVETVVSDDFHLRRGDFTSDELEKTESVFDLLCRVKSTDHAEMLTTVIFSYDCLKSKADEVTKNDIVRFALEWKPHWSDRQDELIRAVDGLTVIGWIHPSQPDDWSDPEDDLY